MYKHVTVMNRKEFKRIWLIPILALSLFPLLLFSVVYVVDFFWLGHRGDQVGFWQLFYTFSVNDARQIMGGMGEVITAVLGIIITVASIIVQLAATRYTPRISEMFFKDRTNLLILAVFLVAAMYSLWINYVIRGNPPHHQFIPIAGAFVNIMLMTVTLLLIAPYFLYVFRFLEPGNIVRAIRDIAISEPMAFRHDKKGIHKAKTVHAIDHLTDIALNALDQKDKGLASAAVDALRELAISFQQKKDLFPPEWFAVSVEVRTSNPDFMSMDVDILEDIGREQSWFEYKIFRQYQMIYNEALNRMRDVDYIVAIDTRLIFEAAYRSGDMPIVDLAIKMFNTYMRATLNARDVRTAYNVFHQYRMVMEFLLEHKEGKRLVDVANFFRYYAQIAFNMRIPFITETVAYDLSRVCELAYEKDSPVADDLLAVLLEVDKEPEGEQQEQSLRGVRKAQVKLATYFLLHDREDLARRIYEDMQSEPLERIQSIREELISVTTKDFWEVIDRGQNFDYLPPDRRALLGRFFGYFALKDA